MRFDFDEDLDLERPGGGRSTGLGWVVLVAILVAVITTLALAGRERRQIRSAVVPAVVGLPEAAARTAAEGAKLTLDVQERLHDPLVPPGAVAWQRPLAGSLVAPGTSVRVKLSLGLPAVTVPVLAGLTQPVAEARLQQLGLLPGRTELRPRAGLQPGMVIASRPSAGSGVAPGSAVDLVVSEGGADARR